MARILVVDDDPTILSLERQVLEREGHVVTTAGDGAEALALVAGQSYDLVLLDITMPRVDGFAVARELRKAEQHRKTPIIFLSARTDSEAQGEGFRAGGSLYLHKPFTAAQLSRLVKSLVR
jgi:DNA-binding response OmpR family regulator